MLVDARRWSPGAAIGCLGLLLAAAVVSLWSVAPARGMVEHPGLVGALRLPAHAPSAVSVASYSSTSTVSFTSTTTGPDLPDARLAILTALPFGVPRPPLTMSGADAARWAWWLLLPGLAVGAVVVLGPPLPKPRHGVRPHAERAPPSWS